MLRRLALALVLFVLSGGAFLAWLWQQRPGLDAYRTHAYSAPPTPGKLTATWFGVTALLLRDGEHAVFIDPFFSRPPGLVNLLLDRRIAPDEALIRRWLARAGVTRLDAVLVSHSHYDHAMDAGVVARLTGAQLVGSESTANIGRGSGLPESQMTLARAGEALQFGPFRVSFIESRHAGRTGGAPTGDITAPLTLPARYIDYRQGGTWSILVEHPQGRVLHHGSAGFVPGALAGRQSDVVFLGVALIDDLPAYLAQTVDAVGAQRVVPVHWDDFTRPLDQPLTPFPVAVRLDRFFDRMAQRPELQVQTLEVGQPVALFPPAP
ncbi:MAG TPA: MBL fold metallo-hydrolase [Solimonas sp.]|nr:MBL fold metallo-hydrolase [Solimonas sp.]